MGILFHITFSSIFPQDNNAERNRKKHLFWKQVAVKVANVGAVTTKGDDCAKKFSKLKSCYLSRRGYALGTDGGPGAPTKPWDDLMAAIVALNPAKAGISK